MGLFKGGPRSNQGLNFFLQVLAYPEGVKGVQRPLNVFNCICTKILSKLCSCVHYMLNFVQENVNNCIRTLISHFASEFSSFCFAPRPLARSPFRKIPGPSPVNSLHYKTWVRLRYDSFKMFYVCRRFAWDPARELITLSQNPQLDLRGPTSY